MALEESVKALIDAALGQLKEDQQRTSERCDSLQQKLEELTTQLEEKTKENAELRGDLEQKTATIQELDTRLKTVEGFDSTGLQGRVARLEDDPTGLGGIKQALEKAEALQKGLEERDKTIEESKTIARAAKSRTDEFDTSLRDFSRQNEEAKEKIKEFHERLTAVETMSTEVRDRQQKVEDVEAGLESTLRNEILGQLENFGAEQLQALQEEFNASKDESAAHTKSLIRGALDLVAKAHRERRGLGIKRDLMLGWREQAWISGRRKMGLIALHNFAQRRTRSALAQWTRVASSETVASRLREEFQSKLSTEADTLIKALEQRCGNLDSALEQRCGNLDSALELRCGTLDTHVKKLGDEKLDVSVHVEETAQRIAALDAVKGQLDVHAQKLEERIKDASEHSERLGSLDSKHEEHGKALTELNVGMEDTAKKAEVQGMVRDLVLIWNSVKQLDAAKSGKTDIDAITLETTNRDKLLKSRLDDLEKVVTMTVAKADEKEKSGKLEDIHTRLEENQKQLRHWEQMWERLAGFVEDLVQKVGELQGEDASKPTATLRPGHIRPPTGGGGGSFGLNHNRSQPKMPNLSASRGSHAPDADVTASTATGGADVAVETKKLWTGSSSKSVLSEAVRDPSRPSSSTRPGSAPRPASAGRRSHDRGTFTR